MKDSGDTTQVRPKGGKRYSPPVLTEYGSVSKLTMAKGSTAVEQPTQKKSCL